jgi:diguanylate cyclase (GGDEF)-like protein
MSNTLPQLNRRILIIDDNEAIHRDFAKVLGGARDGAEEALFDALDVSLFGGPATQAPLAFEIQSAYQGEPGCDLAREAARAGRPYAVAFVDMRMPPGWDGLRTIEELWRVDPHIQVVICSAHSDYEWSDVVERLNHSDKLLVLRKPFEPIEVQQCASALCQKWQNERLVKHHVESLEKVIAARTSGLEAANRQLRHLATHDGLTGLPNRALLEDRLGQVLAQADRAGLPFAVLVCDLDRFKLVNDSMGHAAGDDFLRDVAQRLASVLRGSDTLARTGGDEFVFVLNTPTDAAAVDAFATRALDALGRPVSVDGIEIHVAASFGVALYPQDGDSGDALLANADAAMYAAKQRGGNGVQYFAPSMSGARPDRLRLESDLHQALARNQFVLHYQPKVDTVTGTVRSVEALLRWMHPERGCISPAEFIPVAEESGQIGAIGEWVLREACRQARAWQDAGLPPMRMGVNISAVQFREGRLIAAVERALQEAGLEPRYLELELTETAVMSSPEESIALLEELSCMGVIVSVDDFGTGYSSMSYLRRLPIDKLKIDKSFVREMATRTDDASIVGAIISLAHSLNLKVVAEGVETTAQLAALKALGCDQYQGFHFSPALPAGEFERLVRTHANGQAGAGEDPLAFTGTRLQALRLR